MIKFSESCMFKKSLIILALANTMVVGANAQEKAVSSNLPAVVAQTAFAASVPVATPAPPVAPSAPVASSIVADSAIKVPVKPVTMPPVPVAKPTPTVQAPAPVVPVEVAPMPTTPVTQEQNAPAEEKKEPGIDSKTRSDNEIIRSLFGVFSEAVNTKNSTKLMSVVNSHLIVIGTNQEIIIGKKTVEDYFPKVIGEYYKFERTNFSLDPGTIVEIAPSGDTAKVYGRGNEKYKLRDIEHNLPIRWDATVMKDGEGWKITSFHSGTNFSNNAILDAFEEFGWKAGMAGGLIGVLIGFILGLGVMAVVKRK